MKSRLNNFRYLAKKLPALYEKLQGKVDDEWKELEPKITEGKALIEKHDEMVAQYQKLVPAIDSMSEYLEHSKEDYQNKLLEKTNTEKTLEEYTKLNQAESAQVEALKKDLNEKQNGVSQLHSELNSLKVQLVQMQSDYEKLLEEHQKADKAFTELKKNKEDITTQKESLNSKIKNLFCKTVFVRKYSVKKKPK